MSRLDHRSLSCVALALLVSPMAAFAQRTGTRFGRDATPADADAAMAIVASCIVDRQPSFVRRWLDVLPGTAEEHELVKRADADFGVCVDDDDLVMDNMQLKMKHATLRAAVAYQVVRRRYPRLPDASPLPVATPPWFVAKLAAAGPAPQVDGQELAIEDFAHCVAIGRWRETVALLGSARKTPAEGSAIDAITPALAACLTTGSTVKITPVTLRSMLGQAVYHILTAANPAGSAATMH